MADIYAYPESGDDGETPQGNVVLTDQAAFVMSLDPTEARALARDLVSAAKHAENQTPGFEPVDMHLVVVSTDERRYLARAVDLGRSDERASRILPPTGRDDLLRKLGGRED